VKIKSLLIMLGTFVMAFILAMVFCAIPSHAGDYQYYYDKCMNKETYVYIMFTKKCGQGILGCDSFAKWRAYGTYPKWAAPKSGWRCPDGSYIENNVPMKYRKPATGNGVAPPPAFPSGGQVHRSTQDALDRKLNNERYRIKVRVKNYIHMATLDYATRIPIGNVDEYMRMMNIQNNINAYLECASKLAAKNIIPDGAYTTRSRDISESRLKDLANANVRYFIQRCAK